MLNLLFGPPGAGRRRADNWRSTAGGFRVGRTRTLAGPIIDEDLALTYAAVWACTRLLSESIAALPLQIFRRVGLDRELASDLPLYDILHAMPNDDLAAMPFREGRTMHQVNWGNGFAEIERDDPGDVVALWPVHPTRVLPPQPGDRQRGIAYRIRNNNNSTAELSRREMLHIPGALSEDGVWGKGVITHARESVGFGMATERHGAAYFGSGAQPPGVLTAPGMKDKDTRTAFRAEWKEVHGSPDSNEIVILPLDSTFTPIMISMEDSQFLETRRQNDVVITQWYNVPLHMINNQEKATLNNVEMRGIEFVIYSLMPWVRRQEGEYNARLLSREERREYFIEHNFAGLLRGDLKSRMDAYVQSIQNGLMTINECRRLENLNSIGPAGDQNFIQLNMTTAERMLREPDPKKITSAQAAVPAAQTAVAAVQAAMAQHVIVPGDAVLGESWANTPQQAAALRPLLADALARMFRKEAKAVARALKNQSLDFPAWLETFHAKHRATIAQAVAPFCRAYLVGTRDEAIARLCVDASREILTEAYEHDTPVQMHARLDAWDQTMAAALLTQLIP